MKKKVLSAVILLLWGTLILCLWFGPKADFSDSERRPLAKMPEITVESVLNGKFMSDFADFAVDQFPLRDTFRSAKSLFHTCILGQKDNHGIYIHDGVAAKMEYPLNQTSVDHALGRFNWLYENYLTESEVFMAIVPDKGYYLAEEIGRLSMDYEKLYASVAAGMPYATQIDLRDSLSIDDYYRTDTHWQQENLFAAASKLCESMGITPPNAEDYTLMQLDRPFYGVYYGQAALPMEPDTLGYLQSETLKNCTVYDHETGNTTEIYDLTRQNSKDLYDLFLSGAKALLTIENPGANSEEALIVFRDSFGSSMIPLLSHHYAKITVVDIRYVNSRILDQFIDFSGQDVLFLYSTLVLNSSDILK